MLNIKTSYILPRLHVFLVWILELTLIMSLYIINLSAFITQTENVYCAVRTESLNKIHVNISL